MSVEDFTPPMLAAVVDSRVGMGEISQTPNDAALVDAIRRGAPGSREALYHTYKRRVFALALRIVGSMDAEEVAQEAFIRIFRGLPKFRGDAALGTWIYRLAVNAALSHRSRRSPTPAAFEADEVETSDLAPEPRGDAVLRSRLEKALHALPPGYRAVIVLHDVEGLEHEEVAKILGCHVGTSKSQLHKARAKLRLILSGAGITAAALQDG
ncbi:MAG TPA: sigma-70 family RNA polymerase sigma factor [Polyangia bacterium]|nr:sigma-70 family RNA polymerase sigma factor [Polyangia bacterium]